MTDYMTIVKDDPEVISRQVEARTSVGRAVAGELHGSQALRAATLAAHIDRAERAQRMRHTKRDRRIDPAKQTTRRRRRAVKAARKANRR